MSIHHDGQEYAHDPTRPSSIDLSLELERQLENESPPNSPTHTRPQSLDSHVLASIVTQLRISLADVTKERDDLAHILAETNAREADLKNKLHDVSERCLRHEDALAKAAERHKDDEESITMLRGKVEESRRGLMRLQTESRRKSQISNLSLDMSRAGQPMFGGPTSSRRSSTFTPLTSSVNVGHRRISSVSDSGLVLTAPVGEHGQWPNSPPAPEASFFAQNPPIPASSNSRRISGFFGRTVSPPEIPAVDPFEMGKLRKELASAVEQLEETRHELAETQEAREASEQCVRVLRTFIAENGVGLAGASSDPKSTTMTVPSMSEVLDVEKKPGVAPSRWGFKLWKMDTSGDNTGSAPATPVHAPSDSISSATSTAPAARKFGGLFSSRTSSTSSRPEPTMHQQEPICNGSDTSSVADSAEPISPASEPPRDVLVRDGERSTSDLGLPERPDKSVLDADRHDVVVPEV